MSSVPGTLLALEFGLTTSRTTKALRLHLQMAVALKSKTGVNVWRRARGGSTEASGSVFVDVIYDQQHVNRANNSVCVDVELIVGVLPITGRCGESEVDIDDRLVGLNRRHLLSTSRVDACKSATWGHANCVCSSRETREIVLSLRASDGGRLRTESKVVQLHRWQ